MTRQELENRLINFVVLINQVANFLQKSIGRVHYSNQIIRSSSSSALNYGEALSAESRKDFIHKVKIVLKELRETYVALRIMRHIKLCKSEELIIKAIKENNELISIFVKTVQTSQKKQNSK